MRWNRSTLAALAALTIILSAAASAQEPGKKRNLIVVYQDVVKPAAVEAYESAGREMLALMRAEKLDSPSYDITAFACTDLTYTYLTPMESFASLDSMHTDWMKLETGPDKDKWQALDKRTGDALISSSRSVVVEMPDCDYIPKQPRLKPEDTKYRRLEFFYLFPGKEGEVAKAGKALAAACSKAGIAESWTVFQSVVGQEMPLFIVVTPAKDPGDFLAADAGVMKALGDEGKRLLDQIMGDTRRYEARDVWYNPELSYVSPSTAKAGETGKKSP